MANALKSISFNGEDWEDCMLATIGMSAAWRVRGVMPLFFVERTISTSSPRFFCFQSFFYLFTWWGW